MQWQQAISSFIWEQKYQYRNHDRLLDADIEATWQRVASAVAMAEPKAEQAHWTAIFYKLLENFRFLPAGRILAGAGTDHPVTLLNCFVMGRFDDAVSSFMSTLEQSARTLQQGGGIGVDFSYCCPQGMTSRASGLTASGPLSFLRIWDSLASAMQSIGSRRSAMMGTLRCDHPDIEAFIEAKAHPHELRHFNLSVLVTDEFMQAVHGRTEWPLVIPRDYIQSTSRDKLIYRRWSGSEKKVACTVVKTVKAEVLWKKIIKSAYDYAEPGVIFEDTLNRKNNLWYAEWLSCTNPCGEIPLPAYGACNLGSFNLTQYVRAAFTTRADFDWQQLQADAVIATRFLDNVLDISHYPLREQAEMAKATRRIGLGITGLADSLVLLNKAYASAAGRRFASRVMRTIAEASWRASSDLAHQKGSFPLFQKKKYRQSVYVEALPTELQRLIERQGMRNSHHTAIAPTGTISVLAQNVSSGIEPIFQGTYQRRVRLGGEKIREFTVQDYALVQWNRPGLPPAWCEATEISPLDHLRMQAAVAPYVDNAISKTINIPETYPFKKLQSVYQTAYRLHLKGCTVFRPNPITGSVLCPCEEK